MIINESKLMIYIYRANGTMAVCIKTAGAVTGYCTLHVIEALSDWRVHSRVTNNFFSLLLHFRKFVLLIMCM